MKTPKKLTLTNFTDAELRASIRKAKKHHGMLKCPLCREVFKPHKHNQIFDTSACRIRYWKLEKELGIVEAKLRLDYLEESGELPFKDR